MTVTNLGTGTLGEALKATQACADAVNALVAASLPEVNAKISGYVALSVPSPDFDIASQLLQAIANLMADLNTVAGIPDIAGLGVLIAAGITALESLRLINPDIGARLDADISAICGIASQIYAGVVGANVNGVLLAAMLLLLNGLKATIEANAEISLGTLAHLSAPGAEVLRFDGNFATFGGELDSALNTAGISGQGHALVLVAKTPEVWTSMQFALKTS